MKVKRFLSLSLLTFFVLVGSGCYTYGPSSTSYKINTTTTKHVKKAPSFWDKIVSFYEDNQVVRVNANFRQSGRNVSPRFMRPFRKTTKEKLVGWTDRERGNAVYKPAHIRRKKYRRAGGSTSSRGRTN
jgi:hypothetical protein